ncbi:MAG TPA: hypothetical protein VFH68_13880 [Polyangia bacterium]|jgi:hypothetical protein|nr:hypothetical protein [Polyangia bacterium]
MPWPSRGVYFFFEKGEQRTASGVGPRVTRIGTHALTFASSTSLWHRLAQHRGVVRSGSGNHRGSIFRLLVGEALIERDGSHVETWGVGGSLTDAARIWDLPRGTVKEQERPTELAVSRIIGAMPFVCIPVVDPPGTESMRGLIERDAIALLSNFDKDPIDSPSTEWLGLDCRHAHVRRSGLWNNHHVDKEYDVSFLDVLGRQAKLL